MASDERAAPSVFVAPAGEERRSYLSSGSAHRYFDRWLVLELSDGRLAYIPPTALKYLEAAKAE